MTSWAVDFMKSSGYLGLALLMLAENIFPPIPSEVVVPLAGFIVSQQQLTMTGVIIASTIGSMLGALVFYYLGYKLGVHRIKQWSAKHGRWVAVTPEDVSKAQQWLEHYGVWAVFFLRLVPGLRSLISLPAGIVKMRMWVFLLASVLGTALWNTLLATLGYQLGSQFKQVSQWMGPVSTTIIVVLLVWYVWRLASHYVQRREATPDS